MNLLILGATGLVGTHLLKLALQNSRIDKVIAPTRSPLPPHPKLQNIITDFKDIYRFKDDLKVDATICALGTTIKKAGSKEEFRFVDLDLPLQFAKITHENGTKVFVLNSAMGANSKSSIFYNQVKGELEEKLQALHFESLTIARPGIIGGKRNELRAGEEIAKLITRVLTPVLPKKWQVSEAENIAYQMLKAAIDSPQGNHILSSDYFTSKG